MTVYLPDLATGRRHWRLLLAEPAASALLECLLAPEDPGLPPRLRCAVEGDPLLALWTVCRSQQPCAEAAQAAQWLHAHALAALGSTEPPAPDSTCSPSDGAALVRQVRCDLRTAALAAALANQRHLPADAAYLLGLLAESDQWLRWAEVFCNPAEAPPRQPPWSDDPRPGWLQAALARRGEAGDSGDRQPPSLPGCVAMARRWVAQPGDVPPPEEALFARAMEAADRRAAAWSAAPQGAARHAIPLAGRLARLQQHETQHRALLQQEKLAALAEFADGIGHEVNPVLTVIAGRAQMLLKEEPHPERRRLLALINTQAMRIHEMIADTMQFAKPPRPRCERFDLAALVDRVLQELRGRADQAQVALVHRRADPSPCPVWADRAQMAVVLRALVDNALRAVSSGGWVEVALIFSGQAGEHSSGLGTGLPIQVVVRDNGRGLTDEERRHMFDPFYSGYPAGRGLGMGLPKCWRLVTQHGGRLHVESQPGQGTTMTVILPIGQPCPATAEAPA